jgi:hypothetical protein
VLLITVIATALGALVARGLYADPGPQTPAAVEPSPSSVPPSQQPGSPEVQGTADATTHPLYDTLRPVLQKLFDAINAKDFASYAEGITAAKRAQTSEQDWSYDFSTTRDGSVVVYRIEAGDRTASVLMRFTSTQEPDKAPQALPVDCIEWKVVWAFAEEKGEWKLAAGPASRQPIMERCP